MKPFGTTLNVFFRDDHVIILHDCKSAIVFCVVALLLTATLPSLGCNRTGVAIEPSLAKAGIKHFAYQERDNPYTESELVSRVAVSFSGSPPLPYMEEPLNNRIPQESISSTLEHFRKVTKLVTLMFGPYDINPELMRSLELIPKLATITFLHSNFQNCSFENLHGTDKFAIILKNCTSDSEWSHLISSAKGLYNLGVWDGCIDEPELTKVFESGIHIRFLGIKSLEISADNLAAIKNLPDLYHLSMERVRMPDDALDYILEIPKLKTLQLIDCGITELPDNHSADFAKLSYLYIVQEKNTIVKTGTPASIFEYIPIAE